MVMRGSCTSPFHRLLAEEATDVGKQEEGQEIEYEEILSDNE